MTMTYQPNRAGVAELLRGGTFRSAVHDLAERIAANVRATEPEATDVVVDDYLTDRTASSVTVRDPRARLWHVRDGLLTRAAASAGVEVRSR